MITPRYAWAPRARITLALVKCVFAIHLGRGTQTPSSTADRQRLVSLVAIVVGGEEGDGGPGPRAGP